MHTLRDVAALTIPALAFGFILMRKWNKVDFSVQLKPSCFDTSETGQE